MNKKIYSSIFLIVLLLFINIGCEKELEDDKEPQSSKDLQYVGSWSGTTNQERTISFNVENVAGVPKVTKYSITAKISGSGWSAVETKFGSLNAIISNGSFSYSTGQLEFSGNFSATNKVSGKYKTVSAGPAGYSSGSASGTYTASK